MSYFIFVIDTKQYSGNFERELCAHITNQIGDCEVGDNRIEDAECLADEHPEYTLDKIEEYLMYFKDNIYQKEEEGCYRPCSIYETKGRSNNGKGLHYDVTEDSPYKWPAYESVAIYFHNKPEQEIIEYMKKRALTFNHRNKIDIIGFRLVEVVETITYKELMSEKL